jgi:hypothetical protein
MPNFKIEAYLLVGCTDSGGYVKFTPKCIIVGGEGGVSECKVLAKSRMIQNLNLFYGGPAYSRSVATTEAVVFPRKQRIFP